MEKSLNEETYEKLKYDIMNFRLLPGDSISAQKVALRYDVSRTPAREAIVNLEKEGLLKIIPQSGWHVLTADVLHRSGLSEKVLRWAWLMLFLKMRTVSCLTKWRF